MRILPAVEEEIRRVIRDERAKDPLITVSGLEKAFEAHLQRGFSHQYVSKIADKVAREALVQADRTQIEQRLNLTREKFRLASERVLQIIYWTPETAQKGIKATPPMDIIDTSKNLAMLDAALLKVEIECGMYKKPIDDMAKEMRYEPLPGEVRAVIIAAWEQGGLPPKAAVEKLVPAAPA